jgi:hypothetical protein
VFAHQLHHCPRVAHVDDRRLCLAAKLAGGIGHGGLVDIGQDHPGAESCRSGPGWESDETRIATQPSLAIRASCKGW